MTLETELTLVPLVPVVLMDNWDKTYNRQKQRSKGRRTRRTSALSSSEFCFSLYHYNAQHGWKGFGASCQTLSSRRVDRGDICSLGRSCRAVDYNKTIARACVGNAHYLILNCTPEVARAVMTFSKQMAGERVFMSVLRGGGGVRVIYLVWSSHRACCTPTPGSMNTRR